MVREWLDDAALQMLSKGFCPDCAHRGFLLGPHGGALQQNIECASVACRARFNITLSPIGPAGMVVMAHRIDRESVSGVRWTNAPEWER
jgi:hypothetical protein